MKALTVAQLKQLKDQVLIIDTRQTPAFTEGFVPGSVSLGLGPHFVEWITALVPKETPLVIVAEEEDLADAYEALETLGYKQLKGHLDGGVPAWQAAGKSIDMIIDVTTEELALDLPFDPKLMMVDVRSVEEFDRGHVKKAENFPLTQIIDPLQIAQLDEDSNIYVYCGGGYRSVVACSIIKKEGFHNVRNVLGGFEALKKTDNIPLEMPKKNKEK
ncbi:MAG: rhodanese-like domain-containing protein [Sphingobacteriales bacterium]|nr:MAG: rhodanese-like domain-containing protein [Sphingobacteriales bacterium]